MRYEPLKGLLEIATGELENFYSSIMHVHTVHFWEKKRIFCNGVSYIDFRCNIVGGLGGGASRQCINGIPICVCKWGCTIYYLACTAQPRVWIYGNGASV